jgi:Recombination endonuclease VII
MIPPSKQRTDETRQKERAYYARNRDQIRAYNKARRKRNHKTELAWRARNPERYAAARRRADGLPNPTRPCPPTCEKCGRPPGRKKLALDHCHETGAFRGWLCHLCNLGIGLLGDSVAGLQEAIRYLQR